MTAASDEFFPTGIPHALTSIVGRERELAHGQALLHDDDVRLVTLTGPGGVGKTRLAIALAERAAGDFADGVHFVPLAGVDDPELVASTVASALGLRVPADRPAQAVLLDELPGRDALIVLDNFEQVESAAPLLARLLAAGPSPRLLVTSRSLLRLSGEHQLRVPPLACPDPGQLPPLSELADMAAIRLFTERARAATGEFTVTAENSTAVATVCARLDGLPLAIELAAARLRHMSLAAIVERLEHRLDLLVGGPRDLPPRLRTLRAAIAWSYDLLEPADQALFCRLGIFVGGWTLEAAVAVGDLPHDDRGEMLERLSMLVDASLVNCSPGGQDDPRFSMLETIREFAADQLRRRGEWETTHERHTAYFLALATEAREALDGPEQASWLARLATEQENFRAVITRCFETGDAGVILRLGALLWPFWARQGHLTEGRAILERAVAMGGDADASVRADAVYYLGNLALDLNDYSAARAHFTASLETWRALDDQDGIASGLNGLGIVARDLGDYAAARERFAEALRIWSALDDRSGVAIARHNLGSVATAEGDYAQARVHHEAALALRRELEDAGGVAYSLWALATAARLAGDTALAKARFAESLDIFRGLGDRQGEAFVLRGLAGVAERAGDDLEALRLFRDSLVLRQMLGERNGIVECIEGIAAIAGRRGKLEQATRLLSATAARRDQTAATPSLAEQHARQQTIAQARRTLPVKTFSEAWALGETLSLEQAIAEAMHLTEEARIASRPEAPFNLTPREQEVLALLSQHLTDREIAERLFLSPRTVERHVGAILAKLDTPNRRQAAAYAIRHNLV